MPEVAVKLTEAEEASQRVERATAVHAEAAEVFDGARAKVAAIKAARRAARRDRRKGMPGARHRLDMIARQLPAATAAKRTARRDLREAMTELAAAGRAKADAATGMARLPGGHY